MPKSIRSSLLARSSLSAALALLAMPALAQNLSLLDARVVEGNYGSSMLLFEARLSAPAATTVTFDFGVSDGNAVAGSDYTAISLVGLLSIPAGQTSLMISVPVTGDTSIEPNEYLNASIGNVAGATVARAAAKGLIANDDGAMLMTAPDDPGQVAGSTGMSYDYSAISKDGRFVAFTSTARDLVAGRPANTVKNVYVRDARTGQVTLASVAPDGSDGNGDSLFPALSGDGRYLAFQSAASNLVAGDDNNQVDVFRRDLQTGTTTLVSINYAGTAPSSGNRPSISVTGRYVGFQTAAGNVVEVDTNNATDVFLRDMVTGTTRAANVNPGATDTNSGGAWDPVLSADGRYVAFDRGGLDPKRRDMQTGALEPVIASTYGGPPGSPPNSTSYVNGISANGRYVVFTSWATNLTPETIFVTPQIYVTDMAYGTTQLVSRHPTVGASLDGPSYQPSISADGRYVVFSTYAAATGEEPNDGYRDVYLRDLQTGTYTRVSQSYGGGFSTGGSNEYPAISADGHVVSFLSSAPWIVQGNENARDDIFRVELPQDPTLPALSMSDYWVTEGDTGVKTLYFDVALSAPATVPVTFDFATANGTAVSGSDYGGYNLIAQTIPVGQQSATFTIEIAGDVVREADEAFSVYLGNVSGARVLDGHALVIIGNNDVSPPPSLSIGDISFSEGNAGGKYVDFTVTSSKPWPVPVTVQVATADGTASAGSDYVAASSVLTIPSGSTSATFSVVVNGDFLVEPDETFLAQLSNANGATVADGQAVATIANDDAYPSLTVTNPSVTEGNSGTQQATFQVTLSSAAASPVAFDIATSDGTALAGSDYVARALTGQVIPVGASSATFSVTVNGDTLVEPNETFKVNVSNVSNATIANGQATGTIVNDDVLPNLTINDVSIVEGNSGTKLATFTVQLSAPASAPVGYSIATADEFAFAPGDYTAKSLTGQVIPAGATSASFTVSINGDTAVESNETFRVNVTNVSNAFLFDGIAVGTITNDDVLPALSIGDVSITEGQNSSKNMTFTVSLSAAASGTVSFNIATANGTAIAPGDYTAKTATAQTIAAGTLSKTFVVSIKGDKQVEPNEIFFVNLSGVSANATVADGQAVGTIVNDDGAALSLSRVTTGGLYDDVDDRQGEPVVAPREYALLLLDAAQQVCARAGGATIVGIDGVESLAVLADLADTANRTCARQPRYDAALKANGLGFLVERGTQVLSVAGTQARASAATVLAEGHPRPLTVLLAATPSTDARERAADAKELARQVRARLAADPHARLVVLGGPGLHGLVDLTARSLPTAGADAERVWVSPAMLEEFQRVQLDIPAAPKPKPAQQVLQLLP